MRHKNSGKRLGRTWEHRKALFRNMAKSLLTYGRIQTTETKAKELRRVVDRLVTMAQQNDLHSRRQAYKVLNDHKLVKKLFDEIGPRFSGVQGGYTRVVKLSAPRRGDNAPLAIIEFSLGVSEEPKAPKAQAAKPAAEVAPAPAAPAEETAEAPAEETAESSPEEAAEAPAEEAAEAPAEEAAEAPAEEAAEAPAEEAAETPAEEPEAEKKGES